MDFEKNPLMRCAEDCRRSAKRWLALVMFTLATFLIAVGIYMMQPSPASREIASLLAIASVMANICSFLGTKQCNDHYKSVQYGLSVFEAMKKDLEGTESELEDTQAWLYETENELEQTRGWLDETDNKLYEAWDEAQEARAELREVKLELRRTKEEAELAKRCYESLRRTYSETILDLLKARRERDDLQSKLATARRFVRRLLAKRNELRYKLVEARIGFEFFRDEYVNAEARVADAKKQIEHLEQQIERLETVNKLLAKFATDNV